MILTVSNRYFDLKALSSTWDVNGTNVTPSVSVTVKYVS